MPTESDAVSWRDIVSNADQLREIVGTPSHRVLRKQIDHLDAHCRRFIAKSPFLVISSCDASGHMDTSPKGDPPGFVAILDARTLAIPDRPGNRRVDTFCNVVTNPAVSILFMVPGREETLRVSGTALVVRDLSLRRSLAIGDHIPDLALIVSVDEAMFHCAKCIVRSHLWEPDAWPAPAGLPSLAEAIVAHGALSESVEEMQALIDADQATRLY